MNRVNGKDLNARLGLGAKSARYRKDGIWYHPLKSFPGVLFDESGYVLFEEEHAYKTRPGLIHGPDANHLHIPGTLKSIHGYTHFEPT